VKSKAEAENSNRRVHPQRSGGLARCGTSAPKRERNEISDTIKQLNQSLRDNSRPLVSNSSVRVREKNQCGILTFVIRVCRRTRLGKPDENRHRDLAAFRSRESELAPSEPALLQYNAEIKKIGEVLIQGTALSTPPS